MCLNVIRRLSSSFERVFAIVGACVGVRVCKRESVGARRERKSLRVAGFVVTSCVVTGDALIFFAFRIWVVHFLFDPRRGGVGVDPRAPI